MKIFWLFNHPAPYKVDFLNALGEKCDLHVMFERAEEAGRNPLFYNKRPVSFHYYPGNSVYLGAYNNWTRRPIKHIKDPSYDLLVINGWSTFTEQHAIDYCHRHKIPYCFVINGGIIPEKESKFKTSLKRRYISGAALYFCPDERSKEYLIHYGAKPERIVLYPYSSLYNKEILEKPLTQKDKNAIRRKENLEGKKVFFSVGQFIDRKNYLTLIRLWADMSRDYCLYLIGEGYQKREYEELIEQEGLGNVFLLPFREHSEVLDLLRCGDGFILLSKEDIYGHVIHEALSQGLPVVASDRINAAVHLIENGKNGFVVPLKEEEEIQRAILRLNPDMGEACIEKAKDYTIEKEAEAFYRVFEAALKAKEEGK